ncbi:MAG: universal stress protein [Mycolicibacterium sp.]|uniref:universal stress protein n=1 Tax=Mycolicibacterium sp. TaxID=2320850 RepID=UPI003D130B37
MTERHNQSGIVVAVDDSASASAAVVWAAKDAASRGLPLRIVHVVPPIVVPAAPWPELPAPPSFAVYEEDRRRQIVANAHKLALEATSAHPAPQTTTAVLNGPVVPTLVDLSAEVDMIVVGCLGETAVPRALLGSVSSGVVHQARCPVAVIHGERTPAPDAPVVVGIDGSAASEAATAIAFEEASRRDADLIALHAWTDMGPLEFPSVNWAPIEFENLKVREEEVLAERLSGWQEQYPDVRVRRMVVCDRPALRLLEQAEDAQLIVVGNRGRGGFAGMLLGSVSTALVHSAQIPVIVARQA